MKFCFWKVCVCVVSTCVTSNWTSIPGISIGSASLTSEADFANIVSSFSSIISSDNYDPLFRSVKAHCLSSPPPPAISSSYPPSFSSSSSFFFAFFSFSLFFIFFIISISGHLTVLQHWCNVYVHSCNIHNEVLSYHRSTLHWQLNLELHIQNFVLVCQLLVTIFFSFEMAWCCGNMVFWEPSATSVLRVSCHCFLWTSSKTVFSMFMLAVFYLCTILKKMKCCKYQFHVGLCNYRQ